MFKKSLIFLVVLLQLFLLTNLCFAFDRHLDQRQKVALRLIPFNVNDNRFYIKDVIDGRNDKSNNLGKFRLIFNYEIPVDLQGDFRTDIQALADISFQKDVTKTPIVIKVNVLQLKEWHGLNQYIRAEVKLAFYREKDGQLGKIFEAESYAENQQELLLEGNERNIRVALEKCFKSFAASNWEKVNPVWEEYQKVASQGSEPDTKMTITMPERHQVLLLEPINSANASGWGLNRYEYDINQTGWIKIHSSSTEVFSIPGGNNGTIYNLETRSGVMRRFGNSGFGVLFEGGIPFGIEDDRSYFKIFYGLNFQENLVYFPTGKRGIAATVGFYQSRYFNSDIYPAWDTGIKASLGFQF